MALNNPPSLPAGDRILKRNMNLVEKTLQEQVIPVLSQFVQEKMQARYGQNWVQNRDVGLSNFHIKDGNLNWHDPQVVLKLMINQWNSVFREQSESTFAMRRWVSELLDIRNAAKHNVLPEFDDDSAFRALDSMARLLHQIAANAAAQQVEQIKAEFRQKWHVGEQPTKPAHPFQSLIAEKTEGFVGRAFVFEAIQTFLQTQPNGYFILEADPGMGKSAILAEYARRQQCIVHFNVRSQGMNRADQFLESVCTQLIDRYRLPYNPLPSNALRDGEFLAKLLAEVSASLEPNQQLVIAIDALDEVDTTDHPDGNLLYLPVTLPKGVYFVITQRPILLGLTVNSPLQRFKLMQYEAESQKDIQTYIQARLHQSAQLQAWMAEQQCSAEEFGIQLGQKSEGNFMYLRYILREIEQGEYQDADGLPQGLEAYYEDHWRRMGMTASPLPRSKLKIVYVLAELQEPVSRALIAEFAQEDSLTVQEVLEQWREFLREEPVDQQTCYSIYHASFADFLYRKDIVQAAGDLISRVKRQIANDLLGGLYGESAG